MIYYVIQLSFLAFLVSAMVLRGVRRSSYETSWTAREFEGLRYQFGAQTYRGKSVGFVLRFRAPKGVRFLVRRQSWFDQPAWEAGLVDPPWTHDQKFDKRFYIECEDKHLLDLARERPDLLKLITGLEVRLVANRADLVELRCEDGKLELMVESEEFNRQKEYAHYVLAWLRPLVDAVGRLPPIEKKSFDRGLAVRFVFVSIFMIGVIGGLTVSLIFSRRLIDGSGLFEASVPYSVAALGLALVTTLLWLRGSPGRHRVLAACLLVGLPGFLSCGGMMARWLDLSLAQGPAEVIPLEGAQLGTNGVYFSSSTDAGSPIFLSDAEYERVHASWGSQERRPAILLRYPGALGYPWLEVVLPAIASGNAAQSQPGGAEEIHPEIADTYAAVAGSQMQEKNYASAEKIYRAELIEVERKAGGSDNPLYALVLSNIADTRAYQNDEAGAKSLYLQALEILERHPGPDTSPNSVVVLATLADFALGDGHSEEAEALSARAYARLQDPARNGWTEKFLQHAQEFDATIEEEFGKNLDATDIVRAGVHYEHALKLLERAGTGSEQADAMRRRVIFNAQLQHKREQVITYSLQQIEVSEQRSDHTSDNYVSAIYRLLAIRANQDDIVQVIALWQRMIDARRALLGDNSPQVVAAFKDFAVLHRLSGQWALAVVDEQHVTTMKPKQPETKRLEQLETTSKFAMDYNPGLLLLCGASTRRRVCFQMVIVCRQFRQRRR